MQSVADSVRALGGIAKAAELLRRGHSYRQMGWAAARGWVVRARCGWYASVDTPAATTVALRVGGVLACVSAVQSYGVWTLADSRVHVHVHPHSRGLRSPGDYRKALGKSWRVRVHWLPEAPRAARRAPLAESLMLMTKVPADPCCDCLLGLRDPRWQTKRAGTRGRSPGPRSAHPGADRWTRREWHRVNRPSAAGSRGHPVATAGVDRQATRRSAHR